MNAKDLLRRWIPRSWRQCLHQVREKRGEKKSLAGLPKLPCRTDRLGFLSPVDLRNFWTDAKANAAWREDGQLLAGLGLPEMTGGVNPGDQRALYHLVAGLQPHVVLEIGTHIGCSTVHLALALRRFVAPGGRKPQLVTADIRDVNDPAGQPWRAYGSPAAPRDLLRRLDLDDLVHFETADSLDFLKRPEQLYDLVFLDGLHTAERVYQELPLALALLRPGGFVLLHDYFPKGRPLWSDGARIVGPWLAVQRLQREQGAFQVLPLGDLPWRTKLQSRRTSLALVTASAQPAIHAA